MTLLDKSQEIQTNLDEIWEASERGRDLAGQRTKLQRTQGVRFQRALFAYHRGDYTAALEEFERALRAAEKAQNHGQTVECCTYLLRILAEREEFQRIALIERKVVAIIALKDPAQRVTSRLKSRALYVLGICYCYSSSSKEGQLARYEQAMRNFHESIDFAIASDDKEALAAPLYGAATLLYARKCYPEALRELERLSILLSCLQLPEIESASNLLRAMVKRNLGAHEEALEDAWKAFDSLKHHPHLVLYLHTLCVLGTIFQQKGDNDSARVYLNLADRSLKREEFPRIARLVDDAVASLGIHREQKADLVFDTRTGLLVEKTKGEIRFEGQFVLRDLLRVFLESPGKVFSKSELARKVWRETYDPEVHDNKIYVTIKRLRKLLEPEGASTSSIAKIKPASSAAGRRRQKAAARASVSPSPAPTDYILRAKTGYFLNPKTKVLITDLPNERVPEAVAASRMDSKGTIGCSEPLTPTTETPQTSH